MSSAGPSGQGSDHSDSINPHPSQEYVHGRILGIELTVTNLPRAKEFYESVFDWKFFRYEQSEVVHFTSHSVTGIVHQVEERDHYTLYHDHSKGKQVAPTGKRLNSKAVTFTIQVEDMEQTLRRVKLGKGHIWQEPTRFSDSSPGRDGFVAYIRDTEDNVIGLRSIDPVGSEQY